MCAGSVSGTLLSALAGGEGTTAAQASQALFNQLAKDLLAGGCCLYHSFSAEYECRFDCTTSLSKTCRRVGVHLLQLVSAVCESAWICMLLPNVILSLPACRLASCARACPNSRAPLARPRRPPSPQAAPSTLPMPPAWRAC